MTPAVGLVVPAYRPDVDRLSTYVRALHDAIDLHTVRIELDGDTPEADRWDRAYADRLD